MFQIIRPIIEESENLDPWWIVGFINAEGSFYIYIGKSASYSLGYKVQLRLRISQHIRDLRIIESLLKTLNCGRLYKYPNGKAVVVTIVKFNDLTNNILPLLDSYNLFLPGGAASEGGGDGTKLQDYQSWIHQLMSEGSHLSIEGLDIFRTIKPEMNTTRFNSN